MSTTAREERATPTPRGVGLGALWFGVLAPPLAWGGHLLLNYYLVALNCAVAYANTSLWLQVVTVVAALVTIAAGVTAWRAWRRTGVDERQGWEGTVLGRSGFMALVGVLSSILFLALILLGDLPTFFLSGCR